MTEVVLEQGTLGWAARERISDRYGQVKLYVDGAEVMMRLDVLVLEGVHGTLVADVIETHDSTHVGDWFHGVYPVTPKVGERITLGRGRLRFETETSVGVEPEDGREDLWMDIHALYRAHSQLVKLVFIPDQEDQDVE